MMIFILVGVVMFIQSILCILIEGSRIINIVLTPYLITLPHRGYRLRPWKPFIHVRPGLTFSVENRTHRKIEIILH